MKYICENPRCGKEHDGSYGSGRFCSKKCRMIWIGIESHKTMTKNGTDPKNICSINNKKRRSEYGRWKCLKCNIVFNTRAEYYSHNKKEHPIENCQTYHQYPHLGNRQHLSVSDYTDSYPYCSALYSQSDS